MLVACVVEYSKGHASMGSNPTRPVGHEATKKILKSVWSTPAIFRFKSIGRKLLDNILLLNRFELQTSAV